MNARALALLAAMSAGSVHAACGDSGPTASPDLTAPPGADAAMADAAAPGPVPPTKDVTMLLGPIHDGYGGVPGLGALVLRGGNVAALGAVGVRKIGSPIAITTADRFHLGGVAQSMTATLAAALVEDGKLAWSSRLGDVLAGAPMHASYTSTTLEQLLGQRAGAPAALPADVMLAARAGGEPSAVRDGAVRSLLTRGPEGAAGTFVESDASFLLASAMLERAAGASWESLIATRVFAKLGITTCRSPGADPGAAPSFPWGHVVAVDDTVSAATPGGPDEPPASLAPALGLRCSLADWSRFAQLHLVGARGVPSTFLRPPSFAKLQSPIDIAHGLGWYAVSRPWAGAQLALNYESRDRASFALVWVLPSKDAVIVVAVNQGGAAAAKVADDAVANLVGSVLTTP